MKFFVYHQRQILTHTLPLTITLYHSQNFSKPMLANSPSLSLSLSLSALFHCWHSFYQKEKLLLSYSEGRKEGRKEVSKQALSILHIHMHKQKPSFSLSLSIISWFCLFGLAFFSCEIFPILHTTKLLVKLLSSFLYSYVLMSTLMVLFG